MKNEIQYPAMPEWMTEQQTAELGKIIDNIVGEGEEANAPTWRINQEVRKAFENYIKKNEP